MCRSRRRGARGEVNNNSNQCNEATVIRRVGDVGWCCARLRDERATADLEASVRPRLVQLDAHDVERSTCGGRKRQKAADVSDDAERRTLRSGPHGDSPGTGTTPRALGAFEGEEAGDSRAAELEFVLEVALAVEVGAVPYLAIR